MDRDEDIALSSHFKLSEFLRSDAAVRHGIDMTPPKEVVANLRYLCCAFLEPIRDIVNADTPPGSRDLPLIITSGYRPPELNRLIGGAKNSAHMRGCAADCYVPGWSASKLAHAIYNSGLREWDQLILEFDSWVHFGIVPPGEDAREQILTTRRVNGRVRTFEGLS